MPNFYSILTTIGLTRLATAQATDTPLVFTHLAVGDGNGSPVTPTAGATALVHEAARVPINAVDISPDAPTTVRVEGLLTADVGGFTIREAGLFNGAGELIAYASYQPTYKPNLADGVSAQEYIRVLIVYESPTAVSLSVDTNVITATREYVDDATAGDLYLWEHFT